MKGASELVLAASIALGAVAGSAWALNPATCKARVKPQNVVSYQDGVVLVDAKGVTGTLRWGTAGSRSSCKSSTGAFDMVGNVYEWVADWVPRTSTCLSWGGLSDDQMCLAGAYPSAPGALLRGGAFLYGSSAGPLAVFAGYGPELSGFNSAGFRCAR